ncbi:hypothetical protein BC938DRAFT_481500 [Jimgerdemannia flammicorona]|uniref:Histone deacetylase domain-containing protein n=1 Tax=Jimgerdemannia flammicorona TaxID=994334 RepID=A0A433QG15_9FUNG|nr:hypothetical protein BC938DRAFT_481500 [Jimgerdemannia flammicorona]
MEVIYSEECLKHAPKYEILSGSAKPYFESPQRLTAIKNHLASTDRYAILPPADYTLAPILRVHTSEFVEYLQTAYNKWVEQGGDSQGVLPECFPHPKLLAELGGAKAWIETAKRDGNVLAKAGLYCFDMSTTITGDTWNAAYISCQAALTGVHRLLQLDASSSANKPVGVYALCRPPGHHAGEDVCGGYCYINNVAVSAQFLIDYELEQVESLRIKDVSLAHPVVEVEKRTPKRKVLILDLDYHHGNGTQSIFYTKSNPLYISLHGTPDYPWFTGASHERGSGEGEGYNINIPLSKSTTDAEYLSALHDVLDGETALAFNADVVLVSLGLDTWHMDPIAGFQRLKSLETYWRMGEMIRTCAGTKHRPVLFVQEGGYWIGQLGDMVENVLDGFLGREMRREE